MNLTRTNFVRLRKQQESKFFSDFSKHQKDPSFSMLEILDSNALLFIYFSSQKSGVASIFFSKFNFVFWRRFARSKVSVTQLFCLFNLKILETCTLSKRSSSTSFLLKSRDLSSKKTIRVLLDKRNLFIFQLHHKFGFFGKPKGVSTLGKFPNNFSLYWSARA